MPIQRLQGPSLGNVTANTLTTTASVNAATFYAGANVSLNTSAVFVGNSSVNTVITSSGIIGVVTSPSGFATTLVAGESLAALDAVYVEPTLTSGTAGRVYKMDADVLVKSTQAFFAGFALAAASVAANVSVQQSGVVSGFTGLTTGAVYYAGSTAGAITATKPLHPLPVGIAISTTQLLINTGIKREDEQRGAVYGYAMGGESGSELATTDRITFNTGVTAASTVSNLSQARYDAAGISDTRVYGYALGGYTFNAVTTADRITFTTSTTAAYTAARLSVARDDVDGMSDGTLYGYVWGALLTTADRITFSASTTAAYTTANITTARILLTGLSDGAVYGYVTGGYDGSYVSKTERLTFSTGSVAAQTAANLSQGRQRAAGVSDGAVYGYVIGGDTPAYVNTADRVTFNTSTTAAYTAANLSSARSNPAGVSDGALYGYVMGGYVGGGSGFSTSTDRLTFSASTTAAFTSANLSLNRGGAAGLSDGAV